MLKVIDIVAAYGQAEVLKGVSLEVNNNEVVSLLGANGAGKSTLLKVISGLIRPKKGSILFEGTEIASHLPENIVRSGLIQVPEGRQIFPSLTVKQNLTLGAYTLKLKKEQLNNSFNYIFELFPVLKEKSKNAAGSLSGGEQQMLAIGRALMSKPRMLLLDEPSLGLAPLVVKSIFGIILHLKKQGIPILLVEQNASEALKIADRAYILETGCIVSNQSAKDMLSDQLVKQRYLGR